MVLKEFYGVLLESFNWDLLLAK